MDEAMQKETLAAARKLLENLIHYRSGCSHYETDVTVVMRELRKFYEKGKE